MNNLSLLFASTIAEEPIKLLDGLLTLYKRPNSSQWQCRFKLSTGAWHSASTGLDQIAEATTQAIAIYETVKVKVASDLAIKSTTFRQLAMHELAMAARVVQANPNKRTHVDYIHIYTKYLIPFFGAYQLTQITPQLVLEFESWRDGKMGRHPMASTKRTHSAAYNRIVERARNQALIPKDLAIPLLDIQGAPGEARPAFSEMEIAQLLAYMPSWEKVGRSSRTKEMRQLCRSYVEFLLYTGARPGTELKPMRWKHLQWHWIGDQRYLKVWLSGKTGPRYLIAKHLVVDCLERLITWHQLPYQDLNTVIEARLDRLIFTFPRGVQPYNFNPQFENLLKECNLLKDVAGRNRSLYSLRHTYATFALAEGVDIHTLARQMGTSTLMIERHYSKLTPMMAAEKLA